MPNSRARHAELAAKLASAPCKKKKNLQRKKKKWPLRASNTGPHALGTKLPSAIHLNTWLFFNVDLPATTFIKGKDGKLTLH